MYLFVIIGLIWLSGVISMIILGIEFFRNRRMR